jgi:hypothetical protein
MSIQIAIGFEQERIAVACNWRGSPGCDHIADHTYKFRGLSLRIREMEAVRRLLICAGFLRVPADLQRFESPWGRPFRCFLMCSAHPWPTPPAVVVPRSSGNAVLSERNSLRSTALNMLATRPSC